MTTTVFAENARLKQTARHQALALRRQAVREWGDGLVGALKRMAAYQAAKATGARAPRSSSTSSPASCGKASPRQATC